MPRLLPSAQNPPRRQTVLRKAPRLVRQDSSSTHTYCTLFCRNHDKPLAFSPLPVSYRCTYLFVVRSHCVAALHQRSQLDHAQIDRHERVPNAVDDEHEVLHPLVKVDIELSVRSVARRHGSREKGGGGVYICTNKSVGAERARPLAARTRTYAHEEEYAFRAPLLLHLKKQRFDSPHRFLRRADFGEKGGTVKGELVTVKVMGHPRPTRGSLAQKLREGEAEGPRRHPSHRRSWHY